MEITIGMQHATRELVIESSLTVDDATKVISEGLAGDTLTLEDTNGRRVIIPSRAVAYIELGSDTAHPVGFGH